MPTVNYFKVYSNDGNTLLFTSENQTYNEEHGYVTETGVTLELYNGNEYYVYQGNKKFLGVSGSPNTTEPEYPIGSEITLGGGLSTAYIVEEELPTTKKVVEITYNNSVIATVEVGQTAVIHCENKKLVSDLKFNIKEVEEGNLITFTINGTTYQAVEGMTWGEWVDSEYNTGGLELITYNGESVIGNTDKVLQDEAGNIIKATDLVNQNIYTLIQKANTDTFKVTLRNGTFNQDFEFEKGMTWEQFINSDYNILNDDGNVYFYVSGEKVLFNVFGGGRNLDLNGITQKITDIITAGQTYTFNIGSGGGIN